jgi:hypothetical protein
LFLRFETPLPQRRVQHRRQPRTGDETYTGRGATQDDGRLAILLTSGAKELRMSGTLAKLKVE